MKCANCDAEIKDGSIYCPVCGKEAQMISGYSSLEDDFLHSLLREDKKSKKSPEEIQRIRKRNQYMPIFLTCTVLAFCILIGVVVKLVISNRNDNSYEYQIQMATEELVDHNYESALEYYKRALSLSPRDIHSRLEMAKIYLIREEYDAAIVLLTEVIQLNGSNSTAFELLIDIYAQKEQYGQIKSLYSYAKDAKIKELFDKYIVENPIIYPEAGKHNTHLAVTMVSIEDEPIYYTMDGTDPIANGQLYVDEIPLERSGFYTIKAVCKNIKSNIYSDVVEYRYQIEVFEQTEVTETTETTEVIEVLE